MISCRAAKSILLKDTSAVQMLHDEGHLNAGQPVEGQHTSLLLTADVTEEA